MKTIKQMVIDTLKTDGKWSIKRVSSFVSFHVAIMYGCFIPPALHWFEIDFHANETIFLSLLGYSSASIAGTVWNKKVDKG